MGKILQLCLPKNYSLLEILITFRLTLIFEEEKIRMDALGTHLVENSIEITR